MTEQLFVLKEKHRNVSDQDLLDDLKRVAAQLGRSTLSGNQYATLGKYHQHTIRTRFGAWNQALVAAGLESGIEMNIDTEKLFDNLREVWIKLGRQPGRRDMVTSLSNYSEGVHRKFKPPFSLSATISPALRGVNRTSVW